MPKRTDINSILVIGSGPIVIGQACEFDYAGTQACKALKAEGYRIVLINSNPATMMTDPEIADSTYIEPITPAVLEQIIAIERPDCLLPTLGGQTALNGALALAKRGVLDKYNVRLIGASIKSIELAENRALFQKTMKAIGLDVPWAIKVNNLAEAKTALAEIHFPVVLRSSYSLGGSGAGIAKNRDEFLMLCEQAFEYAEIQEIMIDEAFIGWKEFELEVVRDRHDNCIVVCGIENLDPLGIHTGDSITVAPIQTLTDKEYQSMRQAAFAVLREIGVDTGGSNVQFAIHPETGRMTIIEMNPRVSRSSALVSKASGFPIAKIAAKLAVGYTLDELKNDITGDQLPASFEPSLDYVVVKIPRFNLDKFPESAGARGPKMRSIGEVMAIGRTFQEALQKAIRSLEMGQDGFGEIYAEKTITELESLLKEANPLQLFAIAEAFRRGKTCDEINALTHIDRWFLHQIFELIEMEQTLHSFDEAQLLMLKRAGFADNRLAKLVNVTPAQLKPVYKRIDSCAGEFTTSTAYLYSTYEQVCEAKPTNNKKILIIGSGPNRIGQGIEFDYCCVQAALALKQMNYETIMLNCNPETVSTDYDVVDRLYCTPLTKEDVLHIIDCEKPDGVLVQYGGQTPLLLTASLAAANVPLLGVNLATVTKTEDRQKFREFLQTIGLKQPKNLSIYNKTEGLKAAVTLGFPLIVRPSFVLGGSKMLIVNDMQQLGDVLTTIFVDTEHAVLLEQFLLSASEVDVDAISDGKTVFIPGLLEHIEPAGIHSGDSACITPPIYLSDQIQAKIALQTKLIAKSLKIRGAFNVQFAIQQDDIYVIEVNPRVSRTLPFLCKATGLPLVQIATQCVLGKTLAELNIQDALYPLPYYCVKEAVLPFSKFLTSMPILGPEMKSTGEVMGIGLTPEEAYAKAQFAAGNNLPTAGMVWLSADDCHLNQLKSIAGALINLGFTLCADAKICAYLSELTVECIAAKPSASIVYVVALLSLIKPTQATLRAAHFASAHQICYTTTPEATRELIKALTFHLKGHAYTYQSLQTLHLNRIEQNENQQTA